MKLQLVLHNIRSTYNVGAILRTAEGLGVEEVVYSGYTPRYNDRNLLPHLREKLNHQIAKSALGAETLVKQICADDLSEWLESQKATGAVIAGLENNLSPEETKRKILLGSNLAVSAFNQDTAFSQPAVVGESRLSLARGAADGLAQKQSLLLAPQENLVLVLGEEVHGIPAELRDQMDYFLEIPMVGRKESFNVSIAAAIAMWELKRPTKKQQATS